MASAAGFMAGDVIVNYDRMSDKEIVRKVVTGGAI